MDKDKMQSSLEQVEEKIDVKDVVEAKPEGRVALRIPKSKLEDFKYICKTVYKSDMSKELMRFIDSVIANNQQAVKSRIESLEQENDSLTKARSDKMAKIIDLQNKINELMFLYTISTPEDKRTQETALLKAFKDLREYLKY